MRQIIVLIYLIVQWKSANFKRHNMLKHYAQKKFNFWSIRRETKMGDHLTCILCSTRGKIIRICDNRSKIMFTRIVLFTVLYV
jgi:hypothetical protein